ncbi:hypothetical protein HMI01_26870 [Halolactibacillus miurensis]|uniref:DUF5710 domain-containing protein n=1 Tax=Halolactibacillus miurensis TaxID=306541 RepID=A0A1I6U2H0_9BACI|nr:DUF5710 domain-containing protein [Halolactibacillus miurensis]GEM05699.1 hypothetical protein HMI01_26870 [Halolactibacillus miurensis]SFS95666.1 hypothetical protein SAMN05421668_12116 [Halolactibacillus miurensis]
MPLILNVPYKEKDTAKTIGAKWNPELKKWIAPHKDSYPDFHEWILKKEWFDYIICDVFYIIEGHRQCFKCGENTKVIGFGIENYYWLDFDEDEDNEEECAIYHYYTGEINVASYIDPLPEKVLKYIQSKYNYKMRYSKTIKNSYLANCCDHCDALQGDYFLFNEMDSPFCITDKETAEKLALYRIKLSYDLPVRAQHSWGSGDPLIKEYGSVKELDFNL